MEEKNPYSFFYMKGLFYSGNQLSYIGIADAMFVQIELYCR